MQSFPMFIRTTNRRIVIAGGGAQAAQKARLMLKTDARIVLLAKTRGQTQHKTTAPRKRVETHAGPDPDVLVTLRTAPLPTHHAMRFDSSD